MKKATFVQVPNLRETFDQLKRSSEIRSSDQLPFYNNSLSPFSSMIVMDYQHHDTTSTSETCNIKWVISTWVENLWWCFIPKYLMVLLHFKHIFDHFPTLVRFVCRGFTVTWSSAYWEMLPSAIITLSKYIIGTLHLGKRKDKRKTAVLFWKKLW